MRLVIAAPDAESIALYDGLLDHALRLLPLEIDVCHARTSTELTERARTHEDDVLILDWLLAGAETPRYLRELLALHPSLRTLVVMPLDLRQYRACLWNAGACVGLPKEHLDHEWLLSMLCLMNRAIAREARARDEALAAAQDAISPPARTAAPSSR
jgi:DNA-binding NarL/FixJ family response regulator